MDTQDYDALVRGYQAYVGPSDIELGAAVDAPASTPFCGFVASFGFSWITTQGPG